MMRKITVVYTAELVDNLIGKNRIVSVSEGLSNFLREDDSPVDAFLSQVVPGTTLRISIEVETL